MDKNSVLIFLNLLKEAVEEKAKAAEIQEIDGEYVLFCSVPSPFEEGKDIVYQFAIESVEGGGIICEIIMFAFNDVERQYFPAVNRLTNRLNQYLTLGSFRLSEDTQSVMLVQGAVLNDKTDAVVAADILAQTLMIMENTVDNGSEYFMSLFGGEDINALLERVDKEVMS